MRNPIMTVAFVACIAVPLSVSAEGLRLPTTQSSAEKTGFSQLSELFQKFGIRISSLGWFEPTDSL